MFRPALFRFAAPHALALTLVLAAPRLAPAACFERILFHPELLSAFVPDFGSILKNDSGLGLLDLPDHPSGKHLLALVGRQNIRKDTPPTFLLILSAGPDCSLVKEQFHPLGREVRSLGFQDGKIYVNFTGDYSNWASVQWQDGRFVLRLNTDPNDY